MVVEETFSVYYQNVVELQSVTAVFKTGYLNSEDFSQDQSMFFCCVEKELAV